MSRNEKYYNSVTTAKAVEVEIQKGLETLSTIPNKIITVYGSHMVDESHAEYKNCYAVTNLLAKNGFAVATGGGPGIMKAANMGAKDAGMPSIGFKGALFHGEYIEDDVHTHIVEFQFVFARRFALHIKSDALLFFPGGYGTLDELTEIIVLIQSKILDQVPVICVGREHWTGLFEWVKHSMLKRGLLSNHDEDMTIVDVVDSFEEIMACLDKKL